MARFVHLHVHTMYSLLDGAIRLDPLLGQVQKFGMDSVAVTDHGTMFGTVEFYEKATRAGIKPIIGCECYIAPRRLTDKTAADHKGLSHLVLLAENHEGYRNLCHLVSIAHLEGFYYKPRVDKEALAAHHSGLIAMSACLHGEIPMRIQENRIDLAEEAARFYAQLFGEGNFYLEIQNNGIDVQEKVNRVLLDLGKRLSIPVVATNDCHYLEKEHVRAHDVLLCIQTGKTVQDSDRLKFRTDQLYFKSPEEMARDFAYCPESLENAAAVGARCQVEFDFKTYHFPQFKTGTGENVEAVFEESARAGFGKVMAKIAAKHPDVDPELYRKRLDYEISVIHSMGFAGYFLIVSDFIRFAKENRIPVGPGRGSAAGSLVAYSLGITDLDPIEHGLLFERFLNPDRISMPDIDVDFCINGRDAVFKHVVDRYGGGEYVAQIITFGKLKSRAVIRDVGRALDIPLRQVDAIAKMVPDVLNITLEDALKKEPRILEMAEKQPEVKELIGISRVLEGLPRHASTHAAGVVISDKPLIEYLPLYRGKRGEVVTQFDMKWVEKIGLVKFDFLGLRNLTVIENTLKLIEKRTGERPDLSDLDLGDSDTYRLLSAGDSTGVFQLESAGMRDLLVRLNPACFEDIIALLALYRPGPMESGMIDDYVDRKHGKKQVQYLVTQLEPILKETYGVIVYQEQVMKIASVLASYTMAEADGLRKAMGKKITSEMARHRERFMKGAVENGVPSEVASQLFDLMEKFGGYGFNKSHSAAYALIAFQTAYLKSHYPVEFMAALLTSEMQSTDGVVKYIAECRRHDIPVLPPDINGSDKEFTVSGKSIRFGLMAVKNVGEAAIDSILEVRKEGIFLSLFDFCERVDLRKVNKRVLESLIRCGAFDATGAFRSQMAAALEEALEYGQTLQREKMDPQRGLFNMGTKEKPSINMPVLPGIAEWEDKQRLSLEKESLGFFISGHPLDRYNDLLQKFTNADTLSIKEMEDGKTVRIGGIVLDIKTILTRKGEPMAFLTIEDLQGVVELTLFPSVYANAANVLLEDTPILVQGEVQRDENAVKLLGETVIPIDKAEETWTAAVHLKLDVTRTEKECLRRIYDVFRRNPGSCRTFVFLQIPEKTETVIELPASLALKASPALIREVNGILGYNAVQTVCMDAVHPA
ncbi:MAG: DNA polymerase III subunit alpha [Desulfobacteraceae bacterium]|nr:MAG: DNA polymerase III subunit alpha [Desulfobacteraceae bacterium]